MQYVFILGHNPELSAAEISAVLPELTVLQQTETFLIGEIEILSLDDARGKLTQGDNFDSQKILQRLGGTIKIGQILSQKIDRQIIVDKLKQVSEEGKLNFGVSFYDCSKTTIGMEIKKELQQAGISCRLVTSKEKELSSVVITKNRCHEFMILRGNIIAQTVAVQDFEEYSHFDYGRPSRDLVSGSMPPKLAKMMINLAQAPLTATLLDPFCGSGTIISEALTLGYKKIIGTDIASKAVKDSEKNIKWLATETGLDISDVNILQCDARELNKKIDQVDAIVTEPFLGPPLRGHESVIEIQKNIDELGQLYLEAFKQFKIILPAGGRVVIVFPVFRHQQPQLKLSVLLQIKKLGFTQLDSSQLLYGRADQKVWRQICIFSKNK